MNYKITKAYALDETTGDYEKTYPQSHIGAIFTKDDESENLETKLSNIDENIASHTTQLSDIVQEQTTQNTNIGLKANDTDDNRTTTDKTVTGAINELNANKASQSALNATNTNVTNNTNSIATHTSQIASLASGAPKAVATVAGMTDTTKNYVYTGSETGYTTGNWYYYNGSAWVSGGTYQATRIADKSINTNNLDDKLKSKLLVPVEMIPSTITTGQLYQNTNIGTLSSATTKYYDVSNESIVKIVGTFTKYYDYYVLFDSNNNILSYEYNIADSSVYDKWINCTGATKMAVCNATANWSSTSVCAYQNIYSNTINNIQNNINTIQGEITDIEDRLSDYIAKTLPTVKNGFYNPIDGTFSSMGTSWETYEFNCSEGEIYKVTGSTENQYNALIIFFNGTTLLSYLKRGNATSHETSTDYEFTVPANATKFALFNRNTYSVASISKYEVYDLQAMQNNLTELKNSVDTISNNNASCWKDKKIIWFGTSIPAGGYIGKNNTRTYPQYIANRTGAIVQNEAVGSSSLVCKHPSYVSTENPYGFSSTDFEKVSRCLSNTIAEMQWVIDNYNTFFTTNVPSSLSDADKEQILYNSYENKVLGNIIGSDSFDLVVIDHGHNDNFTVANDASLIETYGDKNIYCLTGALNWLIDMILKINPKQEIVLIGEYENAVRSDTCTEQEAVARDWNLPILKLWELLKWSRVRTITTTGYWTSLGNGTYYWTESGGSSHTLNLLQFWIPDGTHPHTDGSDKALNRIADKIESWMNNNFIG